MPLLWVLLVVMLTITFLSNSDQQRQERNTVYADVTAASVNVLVYRNAAANTLQP